jgi:hypothetical protein
VIRGGDAGAGLFVVKAGVPFGGDAQRGARLEDGAAFVAGPRGEDRAGVGAEDVGGAGRGRA